MAYQEIKPGQIQPEGESILNRPISRRFVLGLAGTATAVVFTDEAERALNTASQIARATAGFIAALLEPPTALAQDNGEIPLDQWTGTSGHEAIIADLKNSGLKRQVIALTTASVVDEILSHVGIRSQNATKPEYRNGHCPDTAKMFLLDLLPHLLGNEEMLGRLQISIQNTVDGAGDTINTYRLVLKHNNTTTAGHDYQAIVSYIHDKPLKGNRYGTVYVVKDPNILKSKGTPITDQKEKESILRMLNGKLKGADSDSANCGNKSTVTEAVPMPVPATNPDVVTRPEASVSLALGGLTIPLGGLALLFAGARLLFGGGRHSEANA